MAGLDIGMYYDEHFRPKCKAQCNLSLWSQVSETCGSGAYFWSPHDVSGNIVFMNLCSRKKEVTFLIWIQGQFNNPGFEREFHPRVLLLSRVINLWGYFAVIACCFASFNSTSTCLRVPVFTTFHGLTLNSPQENMSAFLQLSISSAEQRLHPLINIFLTAMHFGPSI